MTSLQKDLLMYPQSWAMYGRDQEQALPTTQIPSNLTLHHSNDSTDLAMWNAMQNQLPVFGGPPVTQTVTLHEDMPYSASLTPPLSSSNPGFYGWPMNQAPSSDHSNADLGYMQDQGYVSSVVMTPESDAESSFYSKEQQSYQQMQHPHHHHTQSLQYMPYIQMPGKTSI